jgi:mono/diheme cytochrome c family protein
MIHRAALMLPVALMLAPGLTDADEREAAAPRPPVQDIHAATTPDPFPGACVDCHLNHTDRKMDVRLSTLMARWRENVDPKLVAKARAAAPAGVKVEGRHPDVPGALASIPGGCLSCHGKDSKRAPPFASLIHAIHLTGGADNHYVAMFQGSCTHCHKLDSGTGALRVPSGPER